MLHMTKHILPIHVFALLVTFASADNATKISSIFSFDDLKLMLNQIKAPNHDVEVYGTIVFSEVLIIKNFNVEISGIGNKTSAFDGALSTSLFDISNTHLTLKDLQLQNVVGIDFGCIRAKVSTISLIRTSILECSADSGGGLWLESSSLNAQDSVFVNNVGSGNGGVSYLISSSFEAVRCRFLNNRATRLGGVTYAHHLSSFTATNSTFEKNAAVSESGAVAYVYDSSQFRAADSFFSDNTATRGGGVVYISHGSISDFGGSSFSGNSARLGAIAYATMSSTFTTTNSSFAATNSATEGRVVYANLGSFAWMYNSSLGPGQSSSSIHCESTGTIVASQLKLDETNLEFNLADSCLLTLYQVNNDGSREFQEKLRENVISKTGMANLMSWTYPCGPGQWSSDGVEHGIGIDINDPFCDGGVTDPVLGIICPQPCRTCDAGFYLPFSLDRYHHIGARSAIACPVGHFLADEGTNFWFHDELADCLPCPPGSMGNDTGMSKCLQCPAGYYSDDYGSIYCKSARAGHFVPVLGATAELPCPAGTFSAGSANMICSNCSVGAFQPEKGRTGCILSSAGYYVNSKGSTEATRCPPGLYSGIGAASCNKCEVGSVVDREQVSCDLAPPGYYVKEAGAINATACPPGQVAPGSANVKCSMCTAGSFQPSEGQTACLTATAGNFVSGTGATEETPCPPGFFSEHGQTKCTPCQVGYYNNQLGQESCTRCPSLLTTSTIGQERCDKCMQSYFWQPNGNNDGKCVHCNDLCGVDEKDCVVCGEDGTAIETLNVKRGWWRASKKALTVYECPLDHSCRGGESTKTRDQCFDGHRGALCAACDDKYTHDISRNHCIRCSNALFGSENLTIIFLILSLIIYSWLLKTNLLVSIEDGVHSASDQQNSDTDVGTGLLAVEDSASEAVEEDRPNATLKQDCNDCANAGVPSVQVAPKVLPHTKLKIILAAWQILSAMKMVLPQIHTHFPSVYARLSTVSQIIGMGFIDVGSFDCLFNWSYTDKLLFVTLSPIAAIFAGAGLYAFVLSRKGHMETEMEHREYTARTAHSILFFLYIVLPTISTYLFTFFSCIEFDRGGRSSLQVIATQLDFKCKSPSYKAWSVYNALFIVFWPIGGILCLSLVLWRNQSHLNPLVSFDASVARSDMNKETQKAKVRDSNVTIMPLRFFFDIKPKYYLYPVFELGYRLILVSVLAIFYPDSVQQVALGLLIAMTSFCFHGYFEIFIEEDDNFLAVIAQGQVVLLYLAAMSVYAAAGRDIFSGPFFGLILICIFFSSFTAANYATICMLFDADTVRTTVNQIRSVELRQFDLVGGREPRFTSLPTTSDSTESNSRSPASV